MRNTSLKILRCAAGLCIPLTLLVSIGILTHIFGIRWPGEDGSLMFFVSEVGILLFMSLSLSLNLRCGRFDFSLGAVAILAPLLTLGIFSDAGIATLILLSAFFGGLLGLMSGGVQMLMSLPPAFCSLGLCAVYEGLGYICSRAGERKYYFFDDTGSKLRFFAVSVPLVLIFIRFLMRRTLFGYNYRAISQDVDVARRAGVRCELNTLIVDVLSGSLMGVAGAMIYMRNGQSLDASLNFTSVRILFFGLLPLFFGKLLARYLGEFAGDLFGAISGAMIYSAIYAVGFSDDFSIVISAMILLLLLIYLSNRQKIFRRINIKGRT